MDKSHALFNQFHLFIVGVFKSACSSITDITTSITNVFFQNLLQVDFTGVKLFEDIQRLTLQPKIKTLLDYFKYLLHVPLFNQLMKLKFCHNEAALVVDIEMPIDTFEELCQLHQLPHNTEVDLFCLPCTKKPSQATEHFLDAEQSGYQMQKEVDETSITEASQLYLMDKLEEGSSQWNATDVKRTWKKRFYDYINQCLFKKKQQFDYSSNV